MKQHKFWTVVGDIILRSKITFKLRVRVRVHVLYRITNL
jgi:hypothetical protein